MTIHLGPAGRKLLGVLQKHPGGAVYAPHAHRGRRAIVAPMYPESPTPLERVDAVSSSTLWELERAGLVDIDQASTPIEYNGRRHGDQSAGQRVTLLAAGRATCPTCLAIGAMDCTFRGVRTPGWRHSTRPPVPEHLQ